MTHRRSLLHGLLAAGAMLASTLARAQGAYPKRSIALVVPFAAGGPTDVVVRSLAAVMAKSLGQSVVVENKLGAGGTLAAG
jgi:tripartite-type tricarboxylate transporter receptor subunit TctC